MAITILTEPELREIAKAKIRELNTVADVSDGSDFDISARMVAAVAAANQSQIDWLQRQLFPATCDNEYLDDHAAARGKLRKAAIKASGTVIITGTLAGVNVALNDTLTMPDGSQYEVTALGPATFLPVWSGLTVDHNYGGSGVRRVGMAPTVGYIIGSPRLFSIDGEINSAFQVLTGINAVDCVRQFSFQPTNGQVVSPVLGTTATITALEAGAAGNVSGAGIEATLDAPPANIDATCYLADILGGADVESNDDLRARLVAHDRGAMVPGSIAAIRQWFLDQEIVGVSEAFVYPNLAPGSHQVVCYGPVGARDIGTENAALLEAAFAEADFVTASAAVSDQSLTNAVDFDIVLQTKVGFEPDFGVDENSVLTVDVGSTTTRVNTTTDPTLQAGIEVGDRIAVPIVMVGLNIPYIATIQAMDAAGIDLVDAMPTTPTTGGIVTSGSPLSEPLLEAINAWFDTLGPGDEDSGTKFRRFPDPADSFRSEVSGTRFLAAVLDVEGVDDVRFTSPFTDQVAALFGTFRLGVLTVRYE